MYSSSMHGKKKDSQNMSFCRKSKTKGWDRLEKNKQHARFVLSRKRKSAACNSRGRLIWVAKKTVTRKIGLTQEGVTAARKVRCRNKLLHRSPRWQQFENFNEHNNNEREIYGHNRKNASRVACEREIQIEAKENGSESLPHSIGEVVADPKEERGSSSSNGDREQDQREMIVGRNLDSSNIFFVKLRDDKQNTTLTMIENPYLDREWEKALTDRR